MLLLMGDPFAHAVRRWFRDDGEKLLRLNYPLTDQSVVFDVGGYKGEWASSVNEKFKCRVYVFEPMPRFAKSLKSQFSDNRMIEVFDYGLGAVDGVFELTDAADRSSAFRKSRSANTVTVKCRGLDARLLDSLGVSKIDLIKINIEGAEYALLMHIIDSGLINRINYLQIQFHDFVPDAENMRSKIRDALSRTHRENWCYEFVWESWQRRD
jgi:FkbM family methyltransferase